MAKLQYTKAVLTQEYLDTLKINQDTQITDLKLPGFFVRYYYITQRKTFYLSYRAKASQITRSLKIGTNHEMDLDKAKELAIKYKMAVSQGRDPYLELKGWVVSDEKHLIKAGVLFDKYVEEYSKENKKISTYKAEKLYVREYLKPLRNFRIKDIDIEKIHGVKNQLARQSQSKANHALAFLSAFLNWCELFGYRKLYTNPCKVVKKYSLPRRDRVLSQNEYGQLFEAIEYGKQYSSCSKSGFNVIKILALTGCRLSEIKNLRKDEVDFDNGLLRLRDSKTGAKSVPISQYALSIIKEEYDQSHNEYVFPSPIIYDRHLHDLKKPWIYIKERTGFQNMRIHDLRHSFATVASLTGANLSVISSVLGHKQITTTQRYTHINNIAGIKLANEVSGKIYEYAGMAKQPSTQDCYA